MLEHVADWVHAIVGNDYALELGEWREAGTEGAQMFLVVHGDGGNRPDTDVRFPRFKIYLLGRKNQRADAQIILAAANAIMDAVIAGDSFPCTAANVSASEPVGPGYTSENRAWALITLETIL